MELFLLCLHFRQEINNTENPNVVMLSYNHHRHTSKATAYGQERKDQLSDHNDYM